MDYISDAHWMTVLAAVTVMFALGGLPRALADLVRTVHAFRSGLRKEFASVAVDLPDGSPAKGRKST